MRNLITRSISGFVYVSLFLFAILFDAKSYIAITAIFATICIWEFSKIIQFKNSIPYILLAISVYYFSFKLSEKVTLFLLIATLLCSVRLIYNLYNKNKKQRYPSTTIDKIDVTVRYIVLPFSFLIALPFIFGEYQPKIVICILIFIWVNDSFAYLIGKNFGKRKIFESVSPKKTIEGFIGGWIFSLITAFFISQQYTDSTINLIDWFSIASILSIFGTIGDLIESKFKRQANIKDSGNIMPGHGGMLDRLDSLFFAAPFVFLYLYFFI
jgi:phosphatidate cytidylyltransferase